VKFEVKMQSEVTEKLDVEVKSDAKVKFEVKHRGAGSVDSSEFTREK
jgi:hypothetical protein